MKISITTFVLLFVGVFSLFGQTTCNRGNKSYYKNLNKVLNEKDFTKKIEKLEKLTKKYPDIPKTYDVIGDLYQNEGSFLQKRNQYEASMKMFHKANTNYNQVILICPNYHASCYYTVAQNLLLFGKITKRYLTYQNTFHFSKKILHFWEMPI